MSAQVSAGRVGRHGPLNLVRAKFQLPCQACAVSGTSPMERAAKTKKQKKSCDGACDQRLATM
jgi:hypothetical protein